MRKRRNSIKWEEKIEEESPWNEKKKSSGKRERENMKRNKENERKRVSGVERVSPRYEKKIWLNACVEPSTFFIQNEITYLLFTLIFPFT